MKQIFSGFVVCCVALLACNSNDKKVATPVAKGNVTAMLQEEVKKYPDSLLLIHDLVEAYRNEGNYDSALALTRRLIDHDSLNAYLWNMNATLHFERGDTAEATQSLVEAIRIYPLPEYLVALGTLFAITKNDNALLVANELLEFNRHKSGKDAYFIKGLFYNYNNQPQQAIPYLDSCLALDFNYMYAYREKGIALYHLNKFDKAIEVLKKAVTLQNNYDEGYYWLGRCYEKTGNIEEAIQSYQTALLYDKDFIEARTALENLQQ